MPKIINVSVYTADAAVNDSTSPVVPGSVVISGSPNPDDNRAYDTGNFTERAQLNRVLKKRYVTAGSVHVRNVVEALDALGL